MNTDTILKKKGTTITICPQCELQALTSLNNRHTTTTLCPYCGYSSRRNSRGQSETPGKGITVIQENDNATFHQPGIMEAKLQEKITSNEYANIRYYTTRWDKKNRRPTLTDGSLKSLISPAEWIPIPNNEPDENKQDIVLKITAFRGHEQHSAFRHKGLVYAHRTDDQWDIYPAPYIKTTHIPYELAPLRTVSTSSDEWKEMMQAYRRQENLDTEDE